MVNIAYSGSIPGSDESLEDVLSRCARETDTPAPSVHAFSTAFELSGNLDDPQAEPLFDLAIIFASDSGMTGLQVARDARKTGFSGEFMVVAGSASGALEAQRLRIASYLVQPVPAADFEHEIAVLLDRLAAMDADSATIRMRGGPRRVPFSQLVYAQTVNHDQVLHLMDGSTMQLRSSSQDLFDRFSHDPRFLKMGSSFIVNLDLVRTLDTSGGQLVFIEGSSASVPVRFRKPVQDALFSRAEWRKSHAPGPREAPGFPLDALKGGPDA